MKAIAVTLAFAICTPAVAGPILDEDSAIRAAIKKCKHDYPGTRTDATKWIAVKRGERWEVCEIETGATCSRGQGMRVFISPTGKVGKCEEWVTVTER